MEKTITEAPTRRPPSKNPVLSKRIDDFRVGDHLMHPSRGIFILQTVSRIRVEDAVIPCLILKAAEGRSTLAVPVIQIKRGALRALSSRATLSKAMVVLTERRRQQRAVWARRAKDYEAKIKTGDPLLLATVLRDLNRAGERSFSEQQVFHRAVTRLAAEIAAVFRIDRDAAQQKIINRLGSRSSLAEGA